MVSFLDFGTDPERGRQLARFAGCVLGATSEWRLGGGGGEERLLYGAGVSLGEVPGMGDVPRPMVLADPRLCKESPGQIHRASDLPVYEHVRFLLGGQDPPEDLVALEVEAAEEHWRPGGPANDGARVRQGSFGALVDLGGRPAILTAGHVAPDLTAVPDLYDGDDPGGTVHGQVQSTAHAGNARPDHKTADVAVVDLPAGAHRHPPIQRIAGKGQGTVRGAVHRFNAGSAASSAPRGFLDWVVVRNRPGLWGRCWVSMNRLGRHGDSGSPVVDAVGALVGHYVGGSGVTNGYYQDIDYQLPANCTVMAW